MTLKAKDTFRVTLSKTHVHEAYRVFLKDTTGRLHDIGPFLEHHLGLDLQDEDEVEISVEVVSRQRIERFKPTE